MKLETFFEKFDLFADAPNAVEKMRELVLHLAVRGKLVVQKVTDEPASQLLKRVLAEKSRRAGRGERADEEQGSPPDDEALGDEADGFKARVENEQAWCVSLDTIKAGNFNLDLKNPHNADKGPGDVDHLLPEYEQLLAQLA